MKLTKEEWDKIATWIKDNTCGCVWNNFNGESLEKGINGRAGVQE